MSASRRLRRAETLNKKGKNPNKLSSVDVNDRDHFFDFIGGFIEKTGDELGHSQEEKLSIFKRAKEGYEFLSKPGFPTLARFLSSCGIREGNRQSQMTHLSRIIKNGLLSADERIAIFSAFADDGIAEASNGELKHYNYAVTLDNHGNVLDNVLVFRDYKSAQTAEIQYVYVVDYMRRRGLGRGLVDMALRQMSSDGIKHVEVMAVTKEGVSLFSSLSFKANYLHPCGTRGFFTKEI